MRVISIVLFLVSFGSVSLGNEKSDLLNATTLKCNWIGGIGISLDKNGKWDVGEDTLPESIIDSIDLETNRARIIGNAGSATLKVYQFGYGLVFIESKYNYFHTIVIPYSYAPEQPGYYPVFYSRNVSIMGLAHANTNLFGTCKIHQ